MHVTHPSVWSLSVVKQVSVSVQRSQWRYGALEGKVAPLAHSGALLAELFCLGLAEAL